MKRTETYVVKEQVHAGKPGKYKNAWYVLHLVEAGTELKHAKPVVEPDGSVSMHVTPSYFDKCYEALKDVKTLEANAYSAYQLARNAGYEPKEFTWDEIRAYKKNMKEIKKTPLLSKNKGLKLNHKKEEIKMKPKKSNLPTVINEDETHIIIRQLMNVKYAVVWAQGTAADVDAQLKKQLKKFEKAEEIRPNIRKYKKVKAAYNKLWKNETFKKEIETGVGITQYTVLIDAKLCKYESSDNAVQQ